MSDWFVLVVLSLVLANLLAVVVAASLYLDARALARSDRDAPNQFLVGGVGLAYVAGELLPALYVALAPVIAYYLYRRRRYVPR